MYFKTPPSKEQITERKTGCHTSLWSKYEQVSRLFINIDSLFMCMYKNVVFLKILFIYLTNRSQVGRQAGREREEVAGSLKSREADVGLNPGTLGP